MNSDIFDDIALESFDKIVNAEKRPFISQNGFKLHEKRGPLPVSPRIAEVLTGNGGRYLLYPPQGWI